MRSGLWEVGEPALDAMDGLDALSEDSFGAGVDVLDDEDAFADVDELADGFKPRHARTVRAHRRGLGPEWVLPAAIRAAGEAQYIRYEAASPWDGGAHCTGRFTPGAAELGRYLRATFPGVHDVGGYNCRPNTASTRQMSMHGTGRAIDVMIRPVAPGVANSAAGDPVAHWLIRNAADIGVQYIIWNQVSWNGSRRGRKDGRYGGPNPHVDHLHVELTHAGAQRRTPWFRRQAANSGNAHPFTAFELEDDDTFAELGLDAGLTPGGFDAFDAYAPSPERTAFEAAVAARNWNEAFTRLNGLNMFEMLRALEAMSPDDRALLWANREPVASRINLPRIAYARVAVDHRILPPEVSDLAQTGQVFDAARFLAEILGLAQLPTTLDPARLKTNCPALTRQTIPQLRALLGRPLATQPIQITCLAQLLYECSQQAVNDKGRIAYVLASAQHESQMGLLMTELASGDAYEGRADLGNTQAGDGRRYKGRGLVQITGRRNYQQYAQRFGVDLVGNPQLATGHVLAARIAVHGMKNGAFTGRRLDQFGSDPEYDFLGARAIVNGRDCNVLVAEYARAYRRAMR
jgi:hypothetical protein